MIQHPLFFLPLSFQNLFRGSNHFLLLDRKQSHSQDASDQSGHRHFYIHGIVKQKVTLEILNIQCKVYNKHLSKKGTFEVQQEQNSREVIFSIGCIVGSSEKFFKIPVFDVIDLELPWASGFFKSPPMGYLWEPLLQIQLQIYPRKYRRQKNMVNNTMRM